MSKIRTSLPKRIAQVSAIALLAVSVAHAQESQPAITLMESAQSPSVGAQSDSTAARGKNAEPNPFAKNFRQFSQVKVGASAAPELFTLEFHATSELGVISATTKDFHVSGGTCRQGQSYSAGEVCTVEVTFTPQGPGLRSGQLSVANSASVTPFLTPIGGTAYGPAVTFIPSVIETVPGTYVGSGSAAAGLFSGPQSLAIDGGDNLYVADTGNNLIRFRDSSGTFSVFIGGGAASAVGYSGFGTGIKLTSPRGVAVDYTGTVYVADTGDSVVLVRYIDGIINTRIGGGATAMSCSFSSPCLPYNVKITPPYAMATDSQGNVYTTLQVGGSLPGFYMAENEQDNNNYYLLNTTAYNYYSTSPSLAVDIYSNLIYTYEDPGGPLLSPTPLCYILGQNRAYSTSAAGQRFWTVAGSGPCGFTGDGGKATGAEISKTIGQFAYDAAGNLYFADTGNNRIRRVDATTGIIHTVAGSGAVGFGGDGGQSTSATIQAPFGLAVDSLGQVYTTGIGASAASPGNSPQADVRVFGTVGHLSFGTQALLTPSAAQTELISNVGNDTLNFTHVGFSSGSADYALDPNTTTCNVTLPLYSGHSCTIGIIFTPSVVGGRGGALTLTDDTISGVQKIQLFGTGATAAQAVVAPTSHAFASQAVGTQSAAFAVKLSNSGGVPLTINSYKFTGTNAGDFAQTHTCGGTLSAGANCTINVTYKPTATGSRAGTLTVSTSANSPTVTFTGTAAAAVKAKVTLVSMANPATPGRSIVLNSQVVNSAASSGASPTGQVQIREGNAVLTAGELSASGTVSVPLLGLAPGVHMLTAYYLGDASHPVSTSNAVRQVVGWSSSPLQQ